MKIILLLFLSAVAQLAIAQEIGLQLYSVRNQTKEGNVEAVLTKIKSWGITQLEGGGTYGMSQEDYNALLKKIGLKTVSIGAGFDELDKDPAKVLEKALAFDVKFVMCSWIPHKGVQLTPDEAKNAIAVFQKAGKILAEKGISLCYHMHGFEFDAYEGGTLFDYIVKNTDPKYVNFEMDVFWVNQPGQSPVALLKKYPERFLMMHLKDRKPGTPNSLDGRADVETNVVLGYGDVGIAEIMANSKNVKYFFIEDESSRVMEQVPQSLAYLKGLSDASKLKK
jgi:sugar phosphate isomerase/epimerase